ncbi:6-phosphogluconate dehydrogenase, NAD-binding protein, partial [mine drainage metagenome]
RISGHTGGMGAAIARRLQAAGHEVHAWNRSPGALQALVTAGVTVAPDAATAAAQPVVFSMLADDAAVFAVLEQGGALAAMAPDAVHVNMATISVAAAQKMQALHVQRGVGYVAAPVFGRPDAAAIRQATRAGGRRAGCADARAPAAGGHRPARVAVRR